MIRSEGLRNIALTLRNPHYRAFTSGKFVSQITMWMYRMAIAWIVWDMTHSATWLGIFGFIDFAPAMVVSPLAGALADRVDRMKFLRVTQALLLIQAVALSALILFDVLSIELLAILTFYFGIVTAAQMPASQAIIPNLISKSLLTSAYGMNAMIFNLSRFIGPMIAGFIIHDWGTGPVIFANAVGTGFFSVCLALMDVEVREGKSKHGGNLLHDLKDGIRYARGHEGIGPMILILILMSCVAFPITQLMPGIADGLYDAGPRGLAWMIGVLGMGAMLQGAYLAQRSGIAGLTRYVTLSMGFMGTGFIILTLTPWYWGGLLGVSIIGFALAGTKVGSQTLLQYSVDGHMRGRIASFNGVIYHGCPAIGSVVLGTMADLIGMRPTLGVAGGLALTVWVWAMSRRAIMGPALEAGPRGDVAVMHDASVAASDLLPQTPR